MSDSNNEVYTWRNLDTGESGVASAAEAAKVYESTQHPEYRSGLNSERPPITEAFAMPAAPDDRPQETDTTAANETPLGSSQYLPQVMSVSHTTDPRHITEQLVQLHKTTTDAMVKIHENSQRQGIPQFVRPAYPRSAYVPTDQSPATPGYGAAARTTELRDGEKLQVPRRVQGYTTSPERRARRQTGTRQRIERLLQNKSLRIGGGVAVLALVAGVAANALSGDDGDRAEAMSAINQKTTKTAGTGCTEMGTFNVDGSGKIQWLAKLTNVEKPQPHPGRSKSGVDRGIDLALDNSFNAKACIKDTDATVKRDGKKLAVSVDLAKVSYDGAFDKPFTYEPLVITLPDGITEAQYDAANPISWSSVQELNALVSSDKSQKTVDVLAQAETLDAVAVQCGRQVLDMTVDAMTARFTSIASQKDLTLDLDITGRPPAINDSVPTIKDMPKPNNQARQIATADESILINNTVSTCEKVEK